jgi:hypothetical protein
MSIMLMGQLLLGFLAGASILVNIQLMRLGRHHRRHIELLAPLMRSLLLWLPHLALLIVAGAIALGESSLLGYRGSQDVNGLSGFVVGACLSIVADLCASLTLITLREAFKVTDTAGELERALANLASEASSKETEQDED